LIVVVAVIAAAIAWDSLDHTQSIVNGQSR